MARRVLVTGSEGFTGQYVCNEFQKAGWETWGAGVQLRPGKPRYVTIDLLDPTSLEVINRTVRPDILVHLAAKAFIAECEAIGFYETNLLGTRNLLEVLSNSPHPPSCVILASSANVYGNSGAEILNEESPTLPANDYAVSKLAMEYLAKTYMSKLGIVITRPFNYSGVGQETRYIIPKIIEHFKRRQPLIELGNLDVARDFSDVRDIARAYRLLGETQPIGETVNLCSGEAVTLETCIAMVSDITGHNIEVRVNPDFVRKNEIKVLRGCRNKLRTLICDAGNHTFGDTLEWMLT
jgi:nucleoside-diphosphate-sugar epimerase